MMVHYARTPCRVDLAGGWTDVPRFAERVPGAVLNFAINLYSYVRVREAPVTRRWITEYGYRLAHTIPNQRISMFSVDYDASEEVPSFQDIQDIELSGNFALTKAGLRRRPVNYGLDIFTRSEAPPGSGLGTSAAMGVALIGVLNRVAGVHQTPDQIAETAVALETEELQILSGKQDHYAAALGGVQFMTFRGPHVQSVAMPLDPSLLADLQRQIVLVYTGKSRLSSDLHRHVVQRFESNDPTLLSLFEGLTRIALDVRDALLKGQIDEVGKLVHENWNHQKQLYSGISNPDIEQLCAIGIRAGAIGVKACGAGGGGCLAFVCKDGVESYVAKSLKAAGAEVLRFDIAPQGLMVWSRAESE